MTEQQVAILLSGLSVVAMFAVYRLVYVPTIVARLRQDLFLLRRDAVCLVLDGKLDPAHRGFTVPVDWINTLLLRADNVTPLRRALFEFALGSKRRIEATERGRQEFEQIANELVDEDARNYIVSLNASVGSIIIIYWFMRYPFMFVLVGLPLVLFTSAHYVQRLVASLVSDMVDDSDKPSLNMV